MKKLIKILLVFFALSCYSLAETFENYGKTIEISRVPSKVLTLGPNCSELFCALGLQEYIIGNSLDNHSRGPLPEYKEIYDKIPELNYSSATREAVLTSGADFVYGIDWEFGEEALNLAELDKFGITAYINSAQSLEDIYKEILDIGKIFKIENRAEEFVQDQQQRIKDVKDKISGQNPVKVLVYDNGGNGIFTCSGSNFETLLIEQAGGKNIFDDIKGKSWITVSTEEVLVRNPDVIIIHDYDSPSLEEKIAQIKHDPILSQLDCVKNERFVSIALESVLPGDRMAYTIERFAGAFYPEI